VRSGAGIDRLGNNSDGIRRSVRTSADYESRPGPRDLVPCCDSAAPRDMENVEASADQRRVADRLRHRTIVLRLRPR